MESRCIILVNFLGNVNVKTSCQPIENKHSDYLGAYTNIPAMGYVHKKVKHSQNFADLATGVQLQTIESMWRAIKAFVKPR